MLDFFLNQRHKDVKKKTPFRDLSLPPSSVCPPKIKRHKCLSHSVAFKPSRIFSHTPPLWLFTDTVGNEAGNDLRKSWIPSSVSKSLRGLFWTRPRPRPGLSSHFKDAGGGVLHRGRGDHWRAPYKSGNREECPLISALQRVAFK